ncbi:extracellular solute-binding protein [Mycolicibacterium aurum]|uniref:Extracellular solute-binding protein n=2 Tax=Mycolicibacterium aurum TaxID=1791 RepID=A0A448IRN8_MYCAU|nr:extracellular solute-binding protein [Mycolicibacterium aurum]
MHISKMVTVVVAAALAIGSSACSAEESVNNAATSDLAIDKTTCESLAQKYPGLNGKELTVGISPAPANYSTSDPKNPANVIGIEPDLLNAAGQCLGFTTTYSKLDFAGLVPALQSGRIDLVAAGMYSSEERVKQVDFVDYMKASEAALVAAGNPKKIESLADVCGNTAALVVGTVENAILEKQSKDCEASGSAPLKTLNFPSIDRAQSALAQGEADIVLTDAGVTAYLAERAPDKLAVGFDLPTDFHFGFGVSKNATELRDGLNAALGQMYADGGLQKAMKRWGFSPNQELQPAVVTS